MIMKFFKEQGKFLIFLFALGLFLFLFAFPFKIQGNSMQNTFQNNDRIIVSRLLSKFNLLKHGDVIVCKFDGKSIIKRIIALPGEHIVIYDNLVKVNNNILDEPYVINSTDGKIDLILAEDEYFIMGDNRITSYDSRNFGPIKKSCIEAKVLLKIFPSLAFVNFNCNNLN